MNVKNMRSILVSFLLAFVLAFGVSMPAFAYEEGATSASGEDESISVAADGAMVILDANGNIAPGNWSVDVDDGQFNVSVQGAPSNDVVWRSANEMVAQVKYGAAAGFDSNTKATIVITGQGSTPITVSYGGDTAQFRIIVQPINIDSSAYTWGAPANCTYTGNFLEPPVTITGKCLTYVNGTLQQSYGQLKEGIDYMIEYHNNRDVGTATAVVTGVGNYKGTRTFTFQITQAPASGSNGGSLNSSGGSDDIDQSGIASDAGATTVVPQEKPHAPEVTGTWKKTKGKWWFSYDAASASAQSKSWPANEWVTIKGKQYHFKTDGYMNSGWFQSGNTWYYLGSDGAMKTGWQKVKGKWYYLASDGIMQTGKKLINNKIYYLTGSGAMKTGWNAEENGWFYYTSSGAMKTGWQKVKGKWYYLSPSNGIMQTGFYDVAGARYYSNGSGAIQTGWKKLDGKWYHFKNSGAMNMNWAKIKGKWYYLDPIDGSMKTGFYDVGGDRYYSNGSGAMQTGWKKLDGKWYHFKSSGVMETNAWVSGKYWVGQDGVMATNAWVDNEQYYVDGKGVWVKGATR